MAETNALQEQRRLEALRCYDILDTPAEPQFDDLAGLAAQICKTSIALVAFVDSERLWVKAKVGTDLVELPREAVFCEQVVRGSMSLLEVPDAREDARFRDLGVVTEGGIRFYAGVPLISITGQRLGTLCVLDKEAHHLTAGQTEALSALGRQVISQLELRRAACDNARLFSEARQAERRARHDATHDALTGLPNRTYLAERIGQCIGRATAPDELSFGILFLDLDRFKVINDSLGHAAGDLLLNTIASRLGTALADMIEIADTHTIGRFGGDEFVILIEQLTNTEVLGKIVQRVQAAVGKPFYYGGKIVHPGTSIGIVTGPRNYTQADELLRDADVALYQAKSTGRGRYVMFDSRMHEQALRRLTIEGDLRRAADKDELLLHYQPVVSLDDQRTIGFEALVRWKHDGKLVSPADFIPIAEETGLIVPIGRWVLTEAVRRAALWRKRHPGLEPFKMAINISRKQLSDPDLVPLLRRLLTEHPVDPATIMLEITESVIMDEPEKAREVLGRLRELGVRLAMDDFGTGYSSLSCLHELDLDVLKIDRSFIANLDHRRESTVVRAVMDLAHGLGMKVVAEGIETPHQMGYLQASQCDFGQGYLFSKPIEADAAEAFLLRRPHAIAA
ncbi:MAG: EAL domain-containing protein [Tepidisphaeraceae bacterium]